MQFNRDENQMTGLSRLPLSYCTNVHPGRSLAEVEAGLDRYTVPVRQRFGQPLAAGLWLAEPVARQLLSTPDGLHQFADRLHQRNLSCYTLNAFPYGDFHGERVKEQVYLPDWSHLLRRMYTEDCAMALAAMLDEGVEGSISTLPLGFKHLPHGPGFLTACATQLIKCARRLHELHQTSGKLVRIAIEPEPLCVLETTAEAIGFFQELWRVADQDGALEITRTHIGLCFDICHQAVEFEDIGESIRFLHQAGIRINKIHISCALELDDPASNLPGRQALRQYIEPRYLHQTFARHVDGRVVREVDLSETLVMDPPGEFASAQRWRVHFHVPVNREQMCPLKTTRPAIREALKAIAELPYAPHLEVETYTWEVLPGAAKPDLVEGLTREMNATRELIAAACA